MREVFSALLTILDESSPYLILGFALAGVMHVLMNRFPRVTAQLTSPGRRPVFMAALLGAPMPLCSCSVLPAALALRRQGAGKGATASFLVSVPETDVVSVLVTLALIGPFVAVYRPLAAVVSALATGLVIQTMERRETRRAIPATAAVTHPACCHEAAVKPDPHDGAVHASAPRAPGAWWVRALHYGFVEMFDDIVPQLFLGIVLAALIGVWLPDIDPGLVRGHPLLSYLIMVAVGIPVYVCAAASTPIAAGLIAGGVSPGAAMVFLLAGPATNIGSLVVLRAEFGTRILAAYVLMIALTSVALGALLDVMVGAMRIPTIMPMHMHDSGSTLRTVCTLAFLAWIALSFYRSRLFPRMGVRLARLVTRASTR